MSNRLPDLALAAAAAALGIGIVFLFRSMYLAEDRLPFAQEMTLIFLGAVVTIILTAALLNRQTDLELRKEGRVIILQQQCDIYMACIEKVAEIVETARHDARLIDELRVLSHKLAVVASAGVVSSFEQVLESLQSGFADGTLSDGDGERVMNAVAVSLKPFFPELFGVLATPKAEELVATAFRHGGRESAEAFFLDGMGRAIKNMAEQSSDLAPATIYYAFKQSEVAQEGVSSTGWATFLQAVVEAGYAVVGTWPMRTEMANRMVASGTNALANSVVLVCRKKDTTAEVITRAEFIRALKRELPPAIAELQAANIAPADMPQSAIGPGMGVFSRYKAVLESDDSPMSVKTALQLINRELDEYLGGIEGEFDADTRFAITWFHQNGNGRGDYGVADNLARARGISVESVKHAGIVESSAGKVRILNRDELDKDWEPDSDGHLTVWECLQHLVKAHEQDGISHDTAVLLKKIGSHAEAVKDLAYCLYDISANKRKDAKEATAYNALIADWAELTKAAAAIHDTSGDRQIRMGF